MSRRPPDTENQRGTKTQRQVQQESAPVALQRDRQRELDPRERAAKRKDFGRSAQVFQEARGREQ
eukprot:2616744-Pyramimonas_sp.AAC.1